MGNFTALDDYHSIHEMRRRLLGRFECSSEVRLFSFSLVIRELVILSLLSLLIFLSCNTYDVEGTIFSYNGFRTDSDLYIVPHSNWYYYVNDSCYSLEYLVDNAVGRILYPELVQMRDPVTLAVKDFSTTFIYQIYIHPVYVGQGSGLAFIMVPNNFTLGAPLGFLGLLTTTTSTTTKNFASDDQTFGVELDTYLNPEFNDVNDNHIGIDLASMNSTFSYVPNIPLTTADEALYQQVWIDYFQADSRIDIYIAPYNVGKPAVPDKSRASVDLSLLNETMYVGFSAAVGYGADRHTILAWSFSNEGLAPAIFVSKDAPPGASPPPPAPRTPGSPPRNSPPTSLGPSSPPGPPVPLIAGMSVLGVVLFVCTAFGLYYCWNKYVRRPLHIFISHAGGKNGAGKNCAHWLSRELNSNWSLKYRFRVFFDRTKLRKAESFPAQIKRELAITDLGIVMVTEDFFVHKWPMIELATLVAIQTQNPSRDLRILPLFYKFSPEDVKSRLNSWEPVWTALSTDEHPVDVHEWKRAVLKLCIQTGIPYDRINDGYEVEYIQSVKKDVITICDDMRSRRRTGDHVT